MRKIKWTPTNRDREKYAKVQIGCIVMRANVFYPTQGKMKRWRAYVSVQGRSRTLRVGPIRKSMAKAKEDSVRIARELLLDYHTCLLAEMQNFDIEV